MTAAVILTLAAMFIVAGAAAIKNARERDRVREELADSEEARRDFREEIGAQLKRTNGVVDQLVAQRDQLLKDNTANERKAAKLEREANDHGEQLATLRETRSIQSKNIEDAHAKIRRAQSDCDELRRKLAAERAQRETAEGILKVVRISRDAADKANAELARKLTEVAEIVHPVSN